MTHSLTQEPLSEQLPKVLIVDDDLFMRTLLRAQLEAAQYQVIEAGNGQQCLEAYQEYHPDIVLMDAQMPEMDGFTCCSKLKQFPNGVHTPVLMVTGLDDAASVNLAFEVDATDYITKPINPNVLLGRLRRILQATKAEAALREQHALLKTELHQAAEYVSALLPQPYQEKVVINRQFEPSLQLGGDALDYYWLDDDNLVVYLVDVAGHGVKSALLSVSVLNILRARSLPQADFYQPSSVLNGLNQVFQMSDRGEDYFTMWYGVYNFRSRQLTYASAGHPPALLLSLDSQAPVKQLDTGGIPIGMFPDYDFENNSQIIEADTHLYIFSDGVYEIPQPEGIWGLDNFTHLLQDYQQSDDNNLSYVLNKVQDINGEPSLEDDFSLIEVVLA
ncbi:MAG: SpoIIE family protein phosphatase [Cyanobacteria bacterium P01_F01_bin.53]